VTTGAVYVETDGMDSLTCSIGIVVDGTAAPSKDFSIRHIPNNFGNISCVMNIY
jgi:hypothetical protein